MSTPTSYHTVPLPPPSRLSTIHLIAANGDEVDSGAVVTTEAMGRAVMRQVAPGIEERVYTPDQYLVAVVREVAKGGRL